MSSRRVIVVGGGAAGVFAAAACARADSKSDVLVLEKGSELLTKVRISGGGRCNVTHACFDPKILSTYYPRGGKALLSPFRVFQPRNTIDWFSERGVRLKTEPDGRMFPITDSSQTIIDCLLGEAKTARVKFETGCGVEGIEKLPEGGFRVQGTGGKIFTCDRLLVATGGCRSGAGADLISGLGHTVEPPVPSLFTFHVETPWIRELSGVSIENAEMAVSGTKLREHGPLLLTHWGLSGPVTLRTSAWGARILLGMDYKFPVLINWVPGSNAALLEKEMVSRREIQPAKYVVNTPISPLTGRLWEALVVAAGIPRDTRWAALPNSARHNLVQQLIRTELQVTGKSTNKDEFVTCGGVRLSEVDFKTMQSRVCPGLYLAGEVLDIDGLTGGFNFQAAWTTGWIAGQAIADRGLQTADSV